MSYSAKQFKSDQKELGLDNEQLAEALGLSISTITKRRNGKVELNNEALLAMTHLKSVKLLTSIANKTIEIMEHKCVNQLKTLS